MGSNNINNKKPRVCFLFECRYRNDGPPLFLRMAMKKNWERLGILEPVAHYIPGDEHRGGKFDFYIWPDHGEDGLPVKKVVCPKPNIYWASDTHLGMDYRLEKAKEFDIICLTIEDHVEHFKKYLGHDKVYWLPHAGEPTCYTKKAKIKKYDVCFVGHIPNENRINHLDILFKAIPNFWYGQRFFEEASRIYNMSKIVFNNSVAGEANMRAFEACLSGSMLLTDWSEDLAKLGFVSGVNVIFYKSMLEMENEAKYYIKHDKEREIIAKAGRKLVLENHTYLHRAKRMLDIWRNIK